MCVTNNHTVSIAWRDRHLTQVVTLFTPVYHHEQNNSFSEGFAYF